jgi:hypothetical protein
LIQIGAFALPNSSDTRFAKIAKLFSYFALRHLVPHNASFDAVYSYLRFVVSHRRLPSRKMLFNDVLFRIKLRELTDPLRVFVSDKEHLKLYVKATIGDAFNVPTLAVLHSPAEVQNHNFPSACCIKSTHASGHVIIRKAGEPIDKARIISWFRINFYKKKREANYKYLKPKIIVEPLIFDGNPIDYKFFCVNGEPRMIQMDTERHTDHQRLLFDPNWNPQSYGLKIKNTRSTPTPRPDNLGEMLRIAGLLSKPFSFVRIDLYSNGRDVFVGEITHCHGSANERFIPASAERIASAICFGKDFSSAQRTANP